MTQVGHIHIQVNTHGLYSCLSLVCALGALRLLKEYPETKSLANLDSRHLLQSGQDRRKDIAINSNQISIAQ